MRNSLFVIIVLVQLVNAVMARGGGPLAPFVQTDFALTNAQAGMVPAALFLGAVVLGILSGLVVDLLGVRTSLLVAQGVAGVFFILAAFMTSFWALLLLFFFAGAGYAMTPPLTNKAVLHLFPLQGRATAMGIKQTGVSLGGAVAALTFPPLALWQGWRTGVLVVGALITVFAIVSFLLYPGDESVNGAHRGLRWSDLRALVTNVPLLMFCGITFIMLGSQVSLETYLIPYLQDKAALSVVLAGSLLALTQAVGAGGRILWGVMSDRVFNNRRRPVLLIMAATGTVTSIAVPFLAGRVPVSIVMLVLAIWGLAVFGFNGIQMVAVTELAGDRLAGTATGMAITLGSLGAVVSPPLFGAIVDATGSFLPAWLAIALAQVAALAALMFIQVDKAPAASAARG